MYQCGMSGKHHPEQLNDSFEGWCSEVIHFTPAQRSFLFFKFILALALRTSQVKLVLTNLIVIWVHMRKQGNKLTPLACHLICI